MRDRVVLRTDNWEKLARSPLLLMQSSVLSLGLDVYNPSKPQICRTDGARLLLLFRRASFLISAGAWATGLPRCVAEMVVVADHLRQQTVGHILARLSRYTEGGSVSSWNSFMALPQAFSSIVRARSRSMECSARLTSVELSILHWVCILK